MTDISAAAGESGPARKSSVMQVAIARLQSATLVSDSPRPPEEGQRIDLPWLMGMTHTILSSFRSRILALVLGLVTLVLMATISAVAVKARAEVERQAGIQLRTAADTAREALKFRGDRLTSAVEVLTSDFGFKEAVSSADASTLLSAVENQRARISADLVIVLDPHGHPVASTLRTLSAKAQNDLQGLIASDPDGETLQLYRLIDGRPYQLVLAPVLAPEPIGWAAMGFALDDRVATDMSRLLGVDVSFIAGDGQESPYVATSVGEPQRRAVVLAKGMPESAPFVVTTGTDKILTWTNPIRSANGPLTLVLQRSLASALRPYNDVRNSMFGIGAVLLAIASALAVLLARSATRPVEELTRAALRLEAGDYSVAVPPASTTELKGLASAFNAMRAAVADREATIRHQANHDPLTGLPTRVRITEILDGMLIQSRLENQSLTVCLVEIQQFPSIVGSFGHAAGDEVLSEVARQLASRRDERQRVGHIGIDRFLVLLESVGHAEAVHQAQAIVERLRGSFDYAGVSFQLDLRAGVVVFPTDGGLTAELLQRADLAIYRAKETGVTVGVYRDGDDGVHRQRLAILGELRRAIDSDELELHYQPKVEAVSGHVVGCEALVRWQHPQRGSIPPSDFIPHAEQTGLIRSLTMWVMAAALRDLKVWHEAGFRLDVSVNVSPVDLADGCFADNVTHLLAQIGADPSRVVLEVTESGAMKDLAATLRTMEQLRVLGIRFSIDDFGTGYSSLAHLKRLPVDEVKIDRSFIQEIETQPDDDVIVRSTISLGHALNLKVVAEGVELESSRELLGRLGCDLIQGYFISKPLPMREFMAWMTAKAKARDAAGVARAAPAAAHFAKRSRISP
jgi:diguanylate cyclase (GGDEF)-like protein